MAGLRSLTAAIRAPFMERLGLGNPDTRRIEYGKSNAFKTKWQNAAGTADITALQVDADDVLLVGDEAVKPMRQTFNFALSTSASLVDQTFFIVPYACKVEKIEAVHGVANGAAMTGVIKKMADTIALADGTALMSSTFNLNATADTVQTATLSATEGVVDLAYGDRLGIDFTGTLTSLAGLVVTITVSPSAKGEVAVFNMQANGDLIDQAFFVAPRALKVSKILYAHSTLGTNGSAVNVQVTKDVSTDAPGGGTDLLTNNTNAGFNCKAAINTMQLGTLSATAANLRLAVGDRLAVDFAGTLTALAGMVVVVLFEPVYGTKFVTYNLAKNANLADQAFFIANQNCEVVEAVACWSVVSSGATNIQLTADKAVEAAGAGTDLLSLDTNAGFQSDAGANTPERATWKDTRANILLAGDRLSVDYSGTLTALVGVVVVVVLKPV